MNTQHTPGPWWHSGLEVGTVPMMMVKVAKVSGANHQEAQANARLIAAAPDLLEALKRVMDNDCPLTGNPSHAELVEHWEYEKSQGRGEADDRLFALAAIAKATNA